MATIEATMSFGAEVPAAVVAISAQRGWNAEAILYAIAQEKPRPAAAIRAAAQQRKQAKLYDLACIQEEVKARHPRHFRTGWSDLPNGTSCCVGSVGDGNGSSISVMLTLGAIGHTISLENDLGAKWSVSLVDGTLRVRVGVDLPKSRIRNLADQVAAWAVCIGSGAAYRAVSQSPKAQKSKPIVTQSIYPYATGGRLRMREDLPFMQAQPKQGG